MSIDSALGGIQSLSNQVQTGVNTVTRLGADLGLGGVGGNGSFWMDQLKPASYRNVPFGVLEGEIIFGRRNAVHEYPYRDEVWVEDLGRGARKIHMTGFLVGDDCISQREQLIAACETDGLGTLTHPTLGDMIGNMLVTSAKERWDKGRVFEINFSFIESGQRKFPSIVTSTKDSVSSAADAVNAAASEDFSTRASAALKNGAAVVSQAVSTAAAWGRTAQRLANDATNLHNMVGMLSGSFGRFAGGRNSGGLSGSKAKTNNVATIGSLIAQGSVARTSVTSAITSLSSSASNLGL